jgi:hypothetical protein
MRIRSIKVKKQVFANVVMHFIRYLDKMKTRQKTIEVCLLF